MVLIDSIKIEKYENDDVLYVFIAKENSIFYVWSSEYDWDHQDFSLIRKSSNQYKSSQTAFDLFNFYTDTFSSLAEESDEDGYN